MTTTTARNLTIAAAAVGLVLAVAPTANAAVTSGPTLCPVGSGAPVTLNDAGTRADIHGGKWLDSSLTSSVVRAPTVFQLRANFRTSSGGSIIASYQGYSLWLGVGGDMRATGPVQSPLAGPIVADGQRHHARITSNGTTVKLHLDGQVVSSGTFGPVAGFDSFWVGAPAGSDTFSGTISRVGYRTARGWQAPVFASC